MKNTALFLAGALMVGPLPAYEVKGNTMIFSEAEMRACAAEGGCHPVSYTWFKARLDEAREAGKESCKVGI